MREKIHFCFAVLAEAMWHVCCQRPWRRAVRASTFRHASSFRARTVRHRVCLASGLSRLNERITAMTRRRMRLVAFLLAGPTAHHHGMWRHPETDNSFLTPEYYEHIARVLEAGFFDALFFADILALMDFYKDSYATVLERGGQMGLLDPLPMLAQMARVTKHIGLGGSVSSSFVHAFQIARSFASMEPLSNGRMAWNVVTT